MTVELAVPRDGKRRHKDHTTRNHVMWERLLDLLFEGKAGAKI